MIAFPDPETGEYDNLIAQAYYGVGKSGAFVIGSLMRVDPTIKQELRSLSLATQKSSLFSLPQYLKSD